MTPEVIQKLKELAPHIVFSTSREIDQSYVWDGEGIDPRDYDEPMDPYDVTFTAQAVVNGELIEGNDYLGGSYFKNDEPIGDCGGYLLQKLKAALLDLQKVIAHLNNFSNDLDVYLNESDNAVNWMRKEMKRQHEEQIRNNFVVENRFGESFVVRKGIQNIEPIWSEIADNESNCPDLLITNVGTDGDDGLYWTSWEECVAEFAVHAWGLSPILLAESTLYLQKTDQDKMDLMDVIAGYVVRRLGDNFATRLLGQLGYQTGKRMLRPEIMDRITRIETGLGRLLRINYETESADPVKISADALEDANHHDRTAAIRAVNEMTDYQVKQFIGRK